MAQKNLIMDLGYVFYILYEYKFGREIDGYLYIPIAYVILSEYPYFYQFNKICKNIFLEIKKENDEIPIDILIYNIIKFLPSPINKSIKLLFRNQIGIKQNYIEIGKISSSSMLFNQLLGFPIIDINMSFIFNLIPPAIVLEVFIFSFLEYNIIFYSSKLDILNMIMYIFKCFNYPFKYLYSFLFNIYH